MSQLSARKSRAWRPADGRKQGLAPSQGAVPSPKLWPIWLVMGLGLSLACLALALRPPLIQGLPVPDGLRIALAPLAGGGLALPLSLLWLHRARPGRVLRLTRGRLVWALALALLSPLSLSGWLPGIFGFWLAIGAFQIALTGLPLLPLSLLLATPILAYPLASALVYGLSRRWRIPGYLAVFTGQLALAILLGSVFPGEM